jgi:hypothetical protein
MPGRSRHPHSVRPQQGRGIDCIRAILRDFPQVTMVEESIAEETHANWCDPTARCCI